MRMKRYIAFLAAALTLFACQPQQPDGSKYAPAPKLPVSTSTVEFDCDGGYGYVGVTTQEAFEASSNREWLTVTTSSYGVNLNVTENETIETRYAIVTVKSGDLSANVQVVQFGVNTKYFWKDEYSFPYTGGSLELFYKTDETVKIIVEGSEWIDAIPDNGILTINVAQNPLKEIREGFITYIAGEDVRSFAILQALNPSGGGGGGDDPTGPVIFSEDFEDINTLSEWILMDVDGDGNYWLYDNSETLAAHSGVGKLFSQSYDNESGPLTPDNWVFTPAMKLASDDNYLSFWLCPQDASYAQEHYAAYVTTTDPSTMDDPEAACTKVVEGTLTKGHTPAGQVGPMAAGEWENIIVQLPADFNGKTVYIAFRHFDCSDWFYMNLDDVMVTHGEPNASAVSVFAAPATAPVSSYLKRK